MKFGALVQLVRIHACHAWGHGFESRTHREKGVTLVTPFFVVYQTIKALEVDGEYVKIGCIFTGNLPVFPDFYRYFHL